MARVGRLGDVAADPVRGADGRERPGALGWVGVARSKTGQRGAGALLCLAELKASGVPIGKIVCRHLGFTGERIAEAPLFMRGPRIVAWERAGFTNRLRLLIKKLQQAVPSLSVDLISLSAHSLWQGGATAAANIGVSVEAIKEFGRWTSEAMQLYVRKSVGVRRAVV